MTARGRLDCLEVRAARLAARYICPLGLVLLQRFRGAIISRAFKWSDDPDSKVMIKRGMSDSDEAELRKEIEQLKRELKELKEDKDSDS